MEQFQNDFLAKLKSSIDQVQEQVHNLNKALRQAQFGTDKYQFRVGPNPDYLDYYNMITADELMEGESGLFALPFQQKYGPLIEKLFSQITMADDTQLNTRKQSELQENIVRYTDFRTYLKFDLETTDQNGSKQLLSQTLNMKSGGETQTPFYIAVLASFAQLYRVNDATRFGNTVRLVVFDEAFNKMDSDRITESVLLLRKMGLQAIICTPPDKVSDIMPIADRTLLVDKSGYRMHIIPFGRRCRMKEAQVILNRLLDKFENSKHLSEPNTSRRRVMLRIDKRELPEYQYEDAVVRDAYNIAARELEQQALVRLEWAIKQSVLSCIVLDLERVAQCYECADRVHTAKKGRRGCKHHHAEAGRQSRSMDRGMRDAVCAQVRNSMKVPTYCRENDGLLQELLLTFQRYAELSGSVTMRAFSSQCFHDTKYFERNVRELFLTIARKYNTQLAAACTEAKLGERDQLAFLGIYARPELYELSGDCAICLKKGELRLSAAEPYGLALLVHLCQRLWALN